MMLRVGGQRSRVRGGSGQRCWAGMWPALGGGERGHRERRGLWLCAGPSPLKSAEPEFSLCWVERTRPDTGLPGAPDTKVHLRPQATGCHHLSSCPTGEVGTSGGHWSEGGGVTLPSPQCPAGSAESGGVPFPSPYKPQVPPAAPGQLWSAGLFMLTLFSPQFKRSSQSQPSLRAQP